MLLTDGAVFNPDGVIQIALDNSNRMRFCTVGIGHGASEYLIKNIAKVGKGSSEFILDNEDIGDKAIHMIESAVSQYLKDINLKVECFDNKSNPLKVYTKKVEVLLKDQAFKEWVYLENLKGVSYCNCKADIEYYNSLTASYVKKNLTIDSFRTPEVTSFWHKLAYDVKIKELDKQIRFGSDEFNKEELESKIIGMSIKYQILSGYTSFFAVLAQQTVDKDQKVAKVLIPNVDSADHGNPYSEDSFQGTVNLARAGRSSRVSSYSYKYQMEQPRREEESEQVTKYARHTYFEKMMYFKDPLFIVIILVLFYWLYCKISKSKLSIKTA